MAEVKKLTEQEVLEIKTIQEKSQALVVELGQIEILKLQLNSRREAAEAFIKGLETEEQELAKKLEDIYGKGSINLQTGEITVEGEPQVAEV